MDVTVLGCGAAFPRPGGACAGFLVSNGDDHLWMDAGNGTLSRLLQLISLQDLDALVLTHLHSDHIADTLPLMYALGLTDARDGQLPLYAPKSVAANVGAVLGGASRDMFERVFEVRPLKDAFDIGSLHVVPFQTKHPGDTNGLRITAGDRTLVYTSDTSLFPELVDSCRDADLLISEATYLDGREADPGVHMFAREAGAVAKQANARSLVLTHILPTYGPEMAVAEASQEFDGPLEAAVEGKRYPV